MRAAEAAALEAIIPATRPRVASAAVWEARTASASTAILVFAAVGGALLGALGGLAGGVAGAALGCVLAFGFADRVGLVADRAAAAVGGGVGVRRRAAAAAIPGAGAGWTAGGPVGFIAGSVVGYRVGVPLGKDHEALGLMVGFWVGMVCGPPVGALIGALLGGLAGAVGGGLEALHSAVSRAVTRAAELGRLAASVVAGLVVGAGAVPAALVLGVRPDVAIVAAAGGAVVGAFAHGRARWIAFWTLASSTEASLWLLWRRKDGLVAAANPALRLTEGALHCADGPAVSWPWGTRAWFWHGVQVPGRVVERPEALSAHEIRVERDPDVRRVMIERFGGVDRYMREMRADLVQQDDYGRLWRGTILPGDAEPIATVVEVKDATTGDVSLVRVPPLTRTARQAVAWTFGFDDPFEYRPAVET